MTHRGYVIFGAALVFACRTAWFADPVSFLATMLFLAAHYADRFFGSERFESKSLARLTAAEDELKSLKNEMSQIKMLSGIRGGR